VIIRDIIKFIIASNFWQLVGLLFIKQSHGGKLYYTNQHIKKVRLRSGLYEGKSDWVILIF